MPAVPAHGSCPILAALVLPAVQVVLVLVVVEFSADYYEALSRKLCQEKPRHLILARLFATSELLVVLIAPHYGLRNTTIPVILLTSTCYVKKHCRYR